MNEENIDIEEIVRDIKKKIMDEDMVCDLPDFLEIIEKHDKEKYHNILAESEYLKSNSQLTQYSQLTSSKKSVKSIVFFVKRFIRKVIKFYVEPIASEQSEYNGHLAFVIEEMLQIMTKQDQEIQILRREIKDLE